MLYNDLNEKIENLILKKHAILKKNCMDQVHYYNKYFFFLSFFCKFFVSKLKNITEKVNFNTIKFYTIKNSNFVKNHRSFFFKKHFKT